MFSCCRIKLLRVGSVELVRFSMRRSDWEPAYVQWAFNIPLFIADLLLLGMQFGGKVISWNIDFTIYRFLNKGLGSVDTGCFTRFDLWRDWGRFRSWNCFSRKASTGGTDLSSSDYP